MGRMGHIAGRRVSRQHSTVIEAAQPLVLFLRKLPEVTKIALGRLDVHLPSTEWRVKTTEISGGLRLQVRGTNSIQQIMVYTSEPALIISLLRTEFSSKYMFV